MWPFSRKEKEVKKPWVYIEWRVKPEYNGSFSVEKHRYNFSGRDYWENPNLSCGISHKYEQINFNTEKEAEAFIFKKLEKQREADLEAKKQYDFKIMNPPREIPPFRYEHSESKYDHKVPK